MGNIVQSATQPHAKLHRWHNALSFHWLWEAIPFTRSYARSWDSLWLVSSHSGILIYIATDHSNHMVFQEREYCRRVYIWKWICCTMHMLKHDHCIVIQATCVWCTDWWTCKCVLQ
jgi:hypothetical protein